jgi:hypothetical protein
MQLVRLQVQVERLEAEQRRRRAAGVFSAMKHGEALA